MGDADDSLRQSTCDSYSETRLFELKRCIILITTMIVLTVVDALEGEEVAERSQDGVLSERKKRMRNSVWFVGGVASLCVCLYDGFLFLEMNFLKLFLPVGQSSPTRIVFYGSGFYSEWEAANVRLPPIAVGH